MEFGNLKSDPKRKTNYPIEQTGESFPCLKLESKRKTNFSVEQTACEDLKAFERRLTEVIACLQPATVRWRVLLVIVSVCTGIGAYTWLSDPDISALSFMQSLWNHPFFTISALILIFLCCIGIHKRVMAPSIITTRTRMVLSDFNMSCDDTGKLILRPRLNMT